MVATFSHVFHPNCFCLVVQIFQEAVSMIKSIQNPEEAANRLLQEACERGSADNITCVVVRFLTGEGEPSH